MKNSFKKLHQTLFSITDMLEISIIGKKYPENETPDMKYMFGNYTLMLNNCTRIVEAMTRIYNLCVSELDGTFYDKFILPIIDGVDGYNPKTDNVYCFIVDIIEDGDLVVSKDLKEYINLFAETEKIKSNALYELFPQIENSVISLQPNGKAIRISKNEHIESEYNNNAQIKEKLTVGYSDFLKKLKKLAKSKGNLAEIIRLVE